MYYAPHVLPFAVGGPPHVPCTLPHVLCTPCTMHPMQSEGHPMYYGDALRAADWFAHLGFGLPYGTNLAGAHARVRVSAYDIMI